MAEPKAQDHAGWRPKSRGKRRVGWLLALCGAGVAGGAFALLREPEFHARARVALPPDEAKQLARDIVRRGVKVFNEVVNGNPRWEESFAGPAVNAWLAEDFARNHGSMLPYGAREPAVEFDGDRARIGFRYGFGPLSTVVHATVRLWAPKTNVLAVELDSAGAGAAPAPGSLVRNLVERAARAGGAEVSWRRHDGKLVALVRLSARGVALQRAEIKDGALRLAGRSAGVAQALRAAGAAAVR